MGVLGEGILLLIKKCLSLWCKAILFYGAHSTNKAETKKLGWHTGASPADLSMLRIELLCSDHPFLFH